MFSKILIANRGEIAVRIIRACKEMGIQTVAVYSEADKEALHRLLADESLCIGPSSPKESYLNEERIISAALATGATAIHPGYGFLSENAHFAALCEQNGIAFIGPKSGEMERLSSKTAIKLLAKEAGLAVIPGTGALEDVEDAVRQAASIGYPVMLKAVAGGGGRGIRRIDGEKELRDAFPLASAESEAAFSDSSLYLEKLIYPASHIELQMLADEHGKVVCLGERDCSIQIHHQKLIEESPCPKLGQETRGRLEKKAIAFIRHIGYTGAGTLEFLLDGAGGYYFMEMNIRLQVEHGVTEMLTGIDLVKWQIRIAAGVNISFTKEDVRLLGSAIECRINAKSTGKITALHIPGGPFVRFDTYLEIGTEVSPFYDSLLAKLIVYAKNRENALRKLRAYLSEVVIEGVETNIGEQMAILTDPLFVSGKHDTSYFERR